MTSSTRIISKDDQSKSGKMKVMSREVGGAIVQGRHKLTTKVVASGGYDVGITASKNAFNGVIVNKASASMVVTEYTVFLTLYNNLFTDVNDMETKLQEIQDADLEYVTYATSASDGPTNVELTAAHFISGNQHNSGITFDTGDYYVYAILTIDSIKQFFKVYVPPDENHQEAWRATQATVTWPSP